MKLVIREWLYDTLEKLADKADYLIDEEHTRKSFT